MIKLLKPANVIDLSILIAENLIVNSFGFWLMYIYFVSINFVAFRFSPYNLKKCRICKSSVHQVGSHYCQACAYKKGKVP